MGVYLYLHRLPTGPAVDILTERRHYGRVEDEHPELYERLYDFCDLPLPEQPPQTLDFGRTYHDVRGAMLGDAPTREERYDELNREEPEDPRFWAIHGARLVGHRAREYFPWRYSVPSDIETICAVLDEMTEADVRANVEQALEEDRRHEGTTDRMHGRENTQRFMRETLPKCLLPALRQFYRAARAKEQIVVRWMG